MPLDRDEELQRLVNMLKTAGDVASPSEERRRDEPQQSQGDATANATRPEVVAGGNDDAAILSQILAALKSIDSNIDNIREAIKELPGAIVQELLNAS